jgi:ribosome maturation factor RimP
LKVIAGMFDKENIIHIVEELMAGSDNFLVEILIQPVNRISVFIDGDHGVSIEDCRKLSRSIEEKLTQGTDVFELNVSSPGLDRPLKLFRQYRKNIGRGMEIVTVQGDKIDGILSGLNDSGVEITSSSKAKKRQEEQKPISLPFKEIKVAKIKIDFRK